ncbi:unnamed protein product [Closterium sp. NIES-64]|nr:unnamed protein product [Closterium sp. NIES-64]
MPRLNHGSQLAVHIKWAICAHYVANPQLRHVDLARWCFTCFGIRPDRSTIGRVQKGAERWAATATNNNIVHVRGGAHPTLERAMAAWIANVGPAGIPLMLATIRDHVANMARDMDEVPADFRCSIGWVRRALRRQGVRCLSAVGEAADQDMAAVRTTREKLPQLLMYLSVSARDTYNFDETALYIFVLPRKTYGNRRMAGRKIPKDRLTIGLLVNADGSHSFRPLVISKAKRPHDFRPDYNRDDVCYWRLSKKGWMTTELEHVCDGGNGGTTELDEALGDVGILIDRLGLGPSAMPAAEFVRVDDNQPTCAEPGEDPLAMEPPNVQTPEMWEAPANMQAVYDEANPACREARRYARAASEMLIGYAKTTGITLRDLCSLFDIRNPIIRARMERASPPLNLNQTPPPTTPVGSTPPAETPRRHGCVLPAWMTAPTPRWVTLAQQAARRQELIEAGALAVMGGFLDAAEWMRL